MQLFSTKDKSITTTMPEARIVHGVEIKKVPIGQYIKAMKGMEGLPQLIVSECFPDQSVDGVVASLSQLDETALVGLVGRLLVVAPTHLIDALCSIIGLDAEDVTQNKTPKELVDIVKAYWELNDMTSFFKDVWEPIKKRLLPTLITGFNAGLPSDAN